jgi:hypothetical protein
MKKKKKIIYIYLAEVHSPYFERSLYPSIDLSLHHGTQLCGCRQTVLHVLTASAA